MRVTVTFVRYCHLWQCKKTYQSLHCQRRLISNFVRISKSRSVVINSSSILFCSVAVLVVLRVGNKTSENNSVSGGYQLSRSLLAKVETHDSQI